MYLEYYPEEYIELQKELRFHPVLLDRLQKFDQKDVELVIAEIAAYCEIVLDGIYVEADIVRLAELMIPKLRAKRQAPPPIILLH